ncbi:hypothetical protein ACH95_02210 [Bacillus glycinifermentans]|uniref:Uncharacterized protein n=1 Tax=Bacillus glycinifermentans TaxID=1664069 RepID=A0A0J6F1V5_9BACI|nr:hypothetical protein ACH95_02210 [Bacillus glycinifermentans]KRT93659.1 hypothetical protein AB447_217845 [Bacillus glycinifermentans]
MMNTTIMTLTNAGGTAGGERLIPRRTALLMMTITMTITMTVTATAKTATVSNAEKESVFPMMTMTASNAGERSAENV